MKNIKFWYRALRYRYKIDPAEINFIIKNLKPGDIAVDIGSHKGGYLFWMVKQVGQAGKVYAFEPQKKLFNYLKSIVKTKKYANVFLENKGLSDSSGRVEFHIPVTSSGSSPGARIGELNEELPTKVQSIDVVTLDNFFLKKGIIPTLIKIDVEGHEKEVLTGGLELLKKHKPKIIMECENRHLKSGDVFDVFKLLIDLGYEGSFFENKELKPLAGFKIETQQKTGEGRFWESDGYVNNFVFV